MVKRIFQLFLVSTFLVSCTSTRFAGDTPTVKLPQKFKGENRYNRDSIPSAKNFFKDDVLLAWIDSGLQNNHETKQIFARIALANADVKLAKGSFLPQINLQTAVGMQRFGDYTVDGIGNFDTNLSDNITPDRRIPEHVPDLFVGIQTQWEADIWGKLRNRKKAAVARYLSSEKAWNDARLLLVYTIAERYFQLQTLDYKLKIARENGALQERALELISVQKQAGMATELAVKQFEAQTKNTKALEFDLQRAIRETETSFNVLLGRMPANIQRNSLVNTQVKQFEYVLTPEEILKARPDIQAAEWNMQAAGADVASARAAFYPSLALTANNGLHTFRSSVWFQFPVSLAYWMGGSLTAPLLQRNALKAELAASKTKKTIAVLEYERTVVQAMNEVQLYLDNRTLVRNSYELKSDEVNALNAGLSASRDLFVAGLATYLEVITAQKSVLQAQLDLADISLIQLNNELMLYRSMGFGNK